MIYWKKVSAGDYKNYVPKVLKYFYEVNLPNKVLGSVSHISWNPVPFADITTYFPELLLGIEIYGPIKNATILLLTSDSGTLHIDDTTVGYNAGVQARLNIPISNTAGSLTAFYTGLEQYPFKMAFSGGSKTWSMKLKYSLTPVTTVELVEPTILRTIEPHAVFGRNAKFPRVVLTISFEEDVVKYLEE